MERKQERRGVKGGRGHDFMLLSIFSSAWRASGVDFPLKLMVSLKFDLRLEYPGGCPLPLCVPPEAAHSLEKDDLP